jgi:peptidoglycan/xylan/chitin deacetylase (PgdA/CDA1 family)
MLWSWSMSDRSTTVPADSGSRSLERVAITIDTEFPDHPARDPLGTCQELLEILRERHVPATFFIQGSWARAYPGLVARIAADSHLIGAHGYSHCNLKRMTVDGIVDDLNECHDFLLEAGVESRPWFRAPYKLVDARDGRIASAIQAAGYCHVHWDVGGCDWKPGLGAQEIAAITLREMNDRGLPTSIVIFHSWPDPTPQALSLVLEALTSIACPEYVTISQLFHGRSLSHLS